MVVLKVAVTAVCIVPLHETTIIVPIRSHSQLVKFGSLVSSPVFQTMMLSVPSSVSFACAGLHDQVYNNKYLTFGWTFKIKAQKVLC